VLKEVAMCVAAPLLETEASGLDLEAQAAELETAHPEAVLRWAVDEFGRDIALATGFGAEGCVLVAMLSTISRDTRIFYLDTDLLFPETYALRDQLAAQYGVRFERRTTTLSLDNQAFEHGERLWERQPNLCCQLRKVEPLKDVLSGLSAWVTAIRRDQSSERAGIRVVERDEKYGVIKINPLAGWSAIDVWKYIVKNDVPYNPLHDRGYPSIGCMPCTTPVQFGETTRAGRWRGTEKTECGIHQK
jgi:phosphoadenosine phosphosulfate reductase